MISIHEIEKKSEEIKKLEELYVKSIQNINKVPSQIDLTNLKSFIEELYKVIEKDFIFIKNIYQQMDEEDLGFTDPVKYKLIDEMLQDGLYHIEILLNFLKTLIALYSQFITVEDFLFEKLQLLENAIRLLKHGSINPLNLTDEEVERAHKDIQESRTKTLQEILSNIDEET